MLPADRMCRRGKMNDDEDVDGDGSEKKYERITTILMLCMNTDEYI